MPGDERQGVVIRVDALEGQHLAKARLDGAGPDPAEVEALEPGEDGRRGGADLLWIRGGKDEHDPLGRLLQNLEEGVPRLTGEHVRLVHDVHLVAPLLGGGVHGPLAEIPSIVDAPVTGRVDLDDVEIGRPVPDA